MSATVGMNALASRKRLLVAQADIHRRLIAIERLELMDRLGVNPVLDPANRHWLLTAGTVAGLFVMRNWQGALRWLPTLLAAQRLFRR